MTWNHPPRSKAQYYVMGLTCLVAWGLTWVGTQGVQTYGGFVFLAIPFLIGFVPALICAGTQDMTVGESVGVGTMTLVIFAAGIFLFAFEGAICLAMAAPPALVFTWLGALTGLRLSPKPGEEKALRIMVPVLLVPGAFLADESVPSGREVYSVASAVEIGAPPAEVWKAVVAFPPIPEPDDLIFRLGIAYPTHAVLKGEGVGAVRECHFSTGPFIEPITVWEENRVLAFDVTGQPFPMRELSPWPIEPPHLHGFFRSVKGRFDLQPLPGGGTRLTGTTWYVNRFKPEIYWNLWIDGIVHKIHGRVLRHIEATAEGGAARVSRVAP